MAAKKKEIREVTADSSRASTRRPAGQAHQLHRPAQPQGRPEGRLGRGAGGRSSRTKRRCCDGRRRRLAGVDHERASARPRCPPSAPPASWPSTTAGRWSAWCIGADAGGRPPADAARYVDKVRQGRRARPWPQPLAETWAPVLAGAVKQPGATALVASATSTGKDVLPRAAALLEAGMASDIVGGAAAPRPSAGRPTPATPSPRPR